MFIPEKIDEQEKNVVKLDNTVRLFLLASFRFVNSNKIRQVKSCA